MYDERWKKHARNFLQQNPYCSDPYNRHQGTRVRAANVDHIVAHRGNWRLFWDRKNHRSLCTSCHSFKTAMEDGGFGNKKQ